MSRHRVYLDQNKWISLLREHVKDDRDESTIARLRELVEEGEIICPISFIHLIETASYSDDDSVDEMFDLMLDLSLNRTMAPMTVVRDEEIEYLVDEWLGKEPTIDEKVIGDGLAFALGGRHYDVVAESGKLNDEDRNRIISTIESEWASQELLDSEVIKDKFKRERNKEFLEKLEKGRKENEREFNDNDRRRKHEVMGYFSKFVTPEVIEKRIQELAKLPKEDQNDLLGHNVPMDRLESEEYAWEWVQKFPAIYTHVSLTSERDLQKHREIEHNDLNDIMSLSVAIPYCDTVVTENFWSHLSQQIGLDELYDTKVTTDIKDVFDAVK